MPRKKVLTPEEEFRQKRQIEINHMEDCKKHLTSAPTYYFQIGDKVKYGAMKEAVVKEIFYDGKFYGLECKSEKLYYGKVQEETHYRITDWLRIRPITNNVNHTTFTQKDDLKLYFSSRSIEGLLNAYYHFGINLNPEYQREYVWEEKDKEALLDSIFNNIDIGKFVLKHLSDNEWRETDGLISYEIVDGKQRLSTIVEFYENRLKYRGYYFNEIDSLDQSHFLNYSISEAEIQNATKEQVLKYFIKMNKCGKIMSEQDLDKATKLLKEKE